jgi:hypothetical protein
MDDAELRHFDPLIEALVLSGNTLLHGGFIPSHGGPVCYLERPLDVAIVESLVAVDPKRLSYDPVQDVVHRRHCWGAVFGGSAELPLLALLTVRYAAG